LITRRAIARGTGGLALAAALPALSLAAASDQQELVERARATIDEAKHDLFGSAPGLLHRARAVLVVPQLVKGGFFFGGEGGNGVLVARRANGTWSDPAFYVIGSGSFGLQVGIKLAELVMFIMSDRALQAMMNHGFKLGTEAGPTVLVVGSNAQGTITGNVGADVVAWAKSKGAFAGLTLEGSVINPRDEWNRAYYGRPITPSQIVASNLHVPGAEGLRSALAA
jgi:lipid-binding SYLF domain-containing protein